MGELDLAPLVPGCYLRPVYFQCPTCLWPILWEQPEKRLRVCMTYRCGTVIRLAGSVNAVARD